MAGRGTAPDATAVPKPVPARFTAHFEPSLWRDKSTLLADLASRSEQVVDARAAERFAGTGPEPRPGLRSGHIPGSRNLPYERLTDPATRQMRSGEELKALFAAVGVALDRPIVASCGSGVTDGCLVTIFPISQPRMILFLRQVPAGKIYVAPCEISVALQARRSLQWDHGRC